MDGLVITRPLSRGRPAGRQADRQRAAEIVGLYNAGVSMADIADRFGMREDAVYMRLYRIRRQQMAAAAGADDGGRDDVRAD